jgi:uncharacterized membrane protein (UPF0127 family)
MADKRVVLRRDDTLGEDTQNRTVLATNVDVADSTLSQAKGLMFRSDLPEEFALVMEVGGDGLLPIPRGPPRQFVHMLFVRVPIDVVWLVEDEVVKTKRMRPWRSFGVAKADRILELPAGTATEVSTGDTIVLEDADEQQDPAAV